MSFLDKLIGEKKVNQEKTPATKFDIYMAKEEKIKLIKNSEISEEVCKQLLKEFNFDPNDKNIDKQVIFPYIQPMVTPYISKTKLKKRAKRLDEISGELEKYKKEYIKQQANILNKTTSEKGNKILKTIKEYEFKSNIPLNKDTDLKDWIQGVTKISFENNSVMETMPAWVYSLPKLEILSIKDSPNIVSAEISNNILPKIKKLHTLKYINCGTLLFPKNTIKKLKLNNIDFTGTKIVVENEKEKEDYLIAIKKIDNKTNINIDVSPKDIEIINTNYKKWSTSQSLKKLLQE